MGTLGITLTKEEGEILRNVDKLIQCLRSRVYCEKIMDKPSDKDLDRYSTRVAKGSTIKTYEPEYGDPDYWNYPSPEIEAKIKDDGYYKVWYSRRDASDPADSTSWYTVHYVEEVSEFRSMLIQQLGNFLNEIS